MLKFIEDYPQIATLIIATFFTSMGFIIKSLIDFFIEQKKKKTELRAIFWQEKMTAAKKASEHYNEVISAYELMEPMFDVILNGKETPPNLIESLQDSLNKINIRINEPKSFEHHHINIFYKFNERELKEKGIEIIFLTQELHKYLNKGTDLSDDDFKELYLIMTNIKNNIKQVSKTYKSFMDQIRNELKIYID
ncbi:hypothetical protein ACIVBQ_000362 [Tenacibaculum discolor]